MLKPRWVTATGLLWGLLAAACLICYFRFPELLNDEDHVWIVKHIAHSGTWPHVLQWRSAQHSLVYHSLCAYAWGLLGWTGLRAGRMAQGINLACFLGLAWYLSGFLRRIGVNGAARLLSLAVFASSTRWITMSVTVDNDTLMAVPANLALGLTVIAMGRREIPSWKLTSLIALMVGCSAAIKHNGIQFFLPVAGCFLARHWYYGDRLGPILARVALVAAIIAMAAVPIYSRHLADTGTLIHHDQGFHRDNWSGDRWEMFSFRYSSILARPSLPYFEDFGDERICAADLSWPSKLYMNWWSLPDHLPDRPSPAATRLVFVTALPVSLLLLGGLIFALLNLGSDPRRLALVGWALTVFGALFLASIFFPEPRWACHTYPRHCLGAAGAVLGCLGMFLSELWRKGKFVRGIICLIVLLHLAAFWVLLLSGPFYGLKNPWPGYRL